MIIIYRHDGSSPLSIGVYNIREVAVFRLFGVSLLYNLRKIGNRFLLPFCCSVELVFSVDGVCIIVLSLLMRCCYCPTQSIFVWVFSWL